jgi:hypothetical protein
LARKGAKIENFLLIFLKGGGFFFEDRRKVGEFFKERTV